MPKEVCTRKVRKKPAPYLREKKPSTPKKDLPKTSASVKSTIAQHRENLTLADWLTVFKFIDDHPGIKQMQVVRHFKSRKEGALIFTQSTLSRKLEQHTELKSHCDSNPMALSSKRPRIVTRPDVERALYLWVLHMEEDKVIVNGPMLQEKRK